MSIVTFQMADCDHNRVGSSCCPTHLHLPERMQTCALPEAVEWIELPLAGGFASGLWLESAFLTCCSRNPRNQCEHVLAVHRYGLSSLGGQLPRRGQQPQGAAECDKSSPPQKEGHRFGRHEPVVEQKTKKRDEGSHGSHEIEESAPIFATAGPSHPPDACGKLA